ncbi:MAG: tRNA (adenosine(37)-N6)-dimethylallyltransferase MiaA [Ferruginibacter sp.]
MNKTIIIITGATASGKTDLAIAIAKHFTTEIISADSRQCFKELNIGVAKPSAAQLSSIHHYFIDSHSIEEKVTAITFENYALAALEKIFLKNDIAVMVGGTGLYIKAFCEGLDPIPTVTEEIKEFIKKSYAAGGLKWLQEEVHIKDPEFFKIGEKDNPRRMMRALEVMLQTNRSVTTFQSGKKIKRNFQIIKIGLELHREELYKRINSRVDKMLDSGLVKEAENLYKYKDLNALQTVGYRELFSFFAGEINLSKAVELIKQNSRHYAKRQLTWFKKDEEITWVNAHVQANNVIRRIEEIVR